MNEIEVKSILNKHKKRDEWFLGNYTLNPYAGCSIGCIYSLIVSFIHIATYLLCHLVIAVVNLRCSN